MSFDELKVAGDDFGGLLLFEHTTAEDHSLTDRRPANPYSLLISPLLSRKLLRSLPGEARIFIFYFRRIIFLKMFLFVSYPFSFFEFPFSYSFSALLDFRTKFCEFWQIPANFGQI